MANEGLLYEKQIYALLESKYVQLYTHDTIPLKEYYKIGIVESMEDLRKRYLSYKDGTICDRGFDLIGFTGSTFDVIQCKKYSRNIGPDDLGGFISLLFACKERFVENLFTPVHGIVYASSGFTNPLLLTFKNSKSLSFIQEPFISNAPLPLFLEGAVQIQWRDYQVKAIQEFEYLLRRDNKRFSLTLPCATGKGNLSFRYIEFFWAIHQETVFYFAPYKSNISDLAHRAKTLFRDQVQILRIHSTDSKSLIKITNAHQQIKEFLKSQSKKICFVCFDSADKILPFIHSNSFIIFDEFHDLSKQDLVSPSSSIHKILKQNCYILFMSATPRWLDDKLTDYGKNIQTLTWRKAIQNKYINDFKIYLPILNEIEEHGKSEMDYQRVFDKPILQMDFLIFGLLYTGKRKTIVFCTDKNEIKSLRKAYELVVRKYTVPEDFWIEEITLDTLHRKQIIEDFQKSNKRSLLFSIKILDQCIDIPECDSVFFTSLSSNKIRNVQRISRSLRTYKGKLKSAIFCWASCDEDILDFLESLKEFDLNVEEKISILSLVLDRPEKERKASQHKTKQTWKARLENISEYKLRGQERSLFYEFLSLRETVQGLKLSHKKDYYKIAKTSGYEPEPNRKYKSYWLGWYNFLGIDTSFYPQDIRSWRKKCKDLNIKTYSEYLKFVDLLPNMPEELYPSFTNFEYELF